MNHKLVLGFCGALLLACGPSEAPGANGNQACTPSPEVCNDGIDNDCDLLLDCGDTDCTGSDICVGGNDNCGQLNIETGAIPLPDGVGEAFSGSAQVAGFSDGQTLDDSSKFLRICATMEHSWLHDLEISLTCPSGETVVLHNVTVPNSTGAAGMTYLGVPNDPDLAGTDSINTAWGIIEPGEGWEYCWTPDATNGTWRVYADEHNPDTLPEGDYNSFDPWSGFAGCDLNGEWMLTVYDRWGADNGLIFGWDLEFSPDIIADCAGWPA